MSQKDEKHIISFTQRKIEQFRDEFGVAGMLSSQNTTDIPKLEAFLTQTIQELAKEVGKELDKRKKSEMKGFENNPDVYLLGKSDGLQQGYNQAIEDVLKKLANLVEGV